MPKIGKFHPASLKELASWSTLSRNEIGPFLKRYGIDPLGRKYPMLRIYQGVLGLAPLDEGEQAMLGAGLIRTTMVAGMVGLAPDALLEKLRDRNNDYPPLYVLGPRRHLMLRAQVEQMLSSPRNAWQSIAPIADHAVPASRLARALKVRQGRIDALLEDKTNLPAHIISQGRARYIVADVAHRLASAGADDGDSGRGSAKEPQDRERSEAAPCASLTSAPASSGGMFSQAVDRAARQIIAPGSCT